MRQLFSDAPVMQQAQQLPTQPVGSQLAAAMSRPTGMPNYGNPMPNLPVGTLIDAIKKAQTPTTPTAQNMNNAVPQGTMIHPTNGQWTASTDAPPPPPNALQQLLPQMPGQISGANPNAAPSIQGAMPGQASPGMFSGLGNWFSGLFGGGGG